MGTKTQEEGDLYTLLRILIDTHLTGETTDEELEEVIRGGLPTDRYDPGWTGVCATILGDLSRVAVTIFPRGRDGFSFTIPFSRSAT